MYSFCIFFSQLSGFFLIYFKVKIKNLSYCLLVLKVAKLYRHPSAQNNYYNQPQTISQHIQQQDYQ